MAVRSIATLSLSFGLVSIPVKVYSATDSKAAIRFKLMAAGGARVRQQYVADAPEPELLPAAPTRASPAPTGAPAVRSAERETPPAARAMPAAPAERRSAASHVFDFPTSRSRLAEPDDDAPEDDAPQPAGPAIVERSGLVKGYEFEKGRYVLFTPAELKALEAGSRQTIDIVSFIPSHSVDPVYYDKAYYLAPDRRGARPYSLLLRAMQESGRSALARWAFRSKEYVVEIRAAEGVLVLQQLLYADEVRSPADLDIDQVVVGDAELALARQVIEQTSAAAYDPSQFVDEEKQRVLAAIEEKIEGRQIVAAEPPKASPGAQVVDLVAALRASLQAAPAAALTAPPAGPSALPLGERKPVKRAATPRATTTSTKKRETTRRS